MSRQWPYESWWERHLAPLFIGGTLIGLTLLIALGTWIDRRKTAQCQSGGGHIELHNCRMVEQCTQLSYDINSPLFYVQDCQMIKRCDRVCIGTQAEVYE